MFKRVLVFAGGYDDGQDSGFGPGGETFGSLVAIDATTGTLKWRFVTPHRDSFSAGPALGHDGRLYYASAAFFEAAHLYCLDAGTGEPQWIKTLGSGPQDALTIDEQNSLYLIDSPASGMVTKFDADGNELWSYEIGTANSKDSVGVYQDKVFVPANGVSGTPGMHVLDAETGRLLDILDPGFDAESMAIDRDQFPSLLMGGEQPASYWIPPGMPYHNPEIGVRFDPAGARRLLAEAGVNPARLAPVRVVYNTDQTHRLVAETVQAQWQQHLGVRVELENREWKVFLKELTVSPPPVFRLGWGADFPDPDNFMNLFTSYSANNHTGWGNARYDALVEQAAREPDVGRRQALYDEAQRILCEQEVPIAPLFVGAINLAVAERVKGFEPNAMDIFFLERVRAE